MKKLDEVGVASACHILLADPSGATGLETSNLDIMKLEMDDKGVVAHTNHYVLPHHPEVIEAKDWLPDTRYRLSRVHELLDSAVKEGGIESSTIRGVLEDEVEGGGASICRKTKPDNQIATLFRIVMDLDNSTGTVTIGRPTEPIGTLTLLPKKKSAAHVEEIKGAPVLMESLPKVQKVM